MVVDLLLYYSILHFLTTPGTFDFSPSVLVHLSAHIQKFFPNLPSLPVKIPSKKQSDHARKSFLQNPYGTNTDLNKCGYHSITPDEVKT